MQPTPGLSTDFNRYLTHLDAALPRRSRREDRAAQFLHKALGQLHELNQEIVLRLDEFLQRCERFKSSQFWVDEDRRNQHVGECWLPLALLGKNWGDAMFSVLRFRPPAELSSARRILATPAAPGEHAELTVVLRPEVSGVSETAYDRVVNAVRSRFPQIETVFDADVGSLRFTAGRRISESSETHGDPNHPTGGGLPQWLTVLLDLGAVDKVHFTYDLKLREVRETGEFIQSVIAIPRFLQEWRRDDMENRPDVLRSIHDDLGVDLHRPIHIAVTAVEHEWLPVVDAHVKRILDTDALAPEPGTPPPAPAQIDWDLRTRHIARQLTLPFAMEFREDAEYSWARTVFARGDQEEPALLPVSHFIGEAKSLGPELRRRLDDLWYLNAWAGRFRDMAYEAATNLQSLTRGGEPTAASAATRKVPADYLLRVNESLGDFAVYILTSIAGTLDLLISVESEVAEAHAGLDAWHAAWTSESPYPDDGGEAAAIREVVRIIINSDDREHRCQAMATLAYFFKGDDVLPDLHPGGRLDDTLLISKVLLKTHNVGKLPEEVRAWAKTMVATADAKLSRQIQDQIDSAYDELLKSVSKLVEEPKPKASKSSGRGPSAHKAN